MTINGLKQPEELFAPPAKPVSPAQHPQLQAPAQLFPKPSLPQPPAPSAPAPSSTRDQAAVKPLPQGQGLPHVSLDSPEGQEILPGLWFSKDQRTANGGVVRVLTMDPAKIEMVPVFHDKPGPISSRELQADSRLLAAVNASFFGNALVGDVLADGKRLFRDDWNPSLDKITDQRYFVGVSKSGKLLTGKGGLEENKQHAFQHFMGGFPALFTREQVGSLEADIRSGALRKRADYGGASQDSRISRTFMGVNAQGQLLLVTAGAGQQRSKGVTMSEGARLMKSLGAVEAYVLDGGGSTSMFVRDHDFAPTDGRQVWAYLGLRQR